MKTPTAPSNSPLAVAKINEEAIVNHRRDLAAQIAALTGHTAKGQKTYDADGWKVTVKAPLIRSMDWKAWAQVKGDIPADLHPIKVKEELDPKGVEWIAANDPQTWAKLAPCITTKPGAMSVTVTPKEA